MPSLDAATPLHASGPCKTCQVSVYRTYCRQCDEHLAVCKCRPHGHEGHPVYPLPHLPFHPVSVAWDAVDHALRGQRTSTGDGPAVRCPVCDHTTTVNTEVSST